MRRRDFFKTLALGAAAAAAQVYLPKLPDRMRWKTQLTGGIYAINPEWVTAPYEVFFMFQGPVPKEIHPVIYRRGTTNVQEVATKHGMQFFVDSIPIRFKELGEAPVSALKRI